jgi:protein translocase SecG subunit
MNYLVLAQIIQIILSVVMVVLTLIQRKGVGLSSSLSGSIGFYRSRRGIEKLVFGSTIAVGILIVANSLLIVFLT